MSGGSWDYLYVRMQDAAVDLILENDPLRKAFGKKMKLFAVAMRDIERADSGDTAESREHESIKKALGKSANKLVMAELIEEAKALIQKLKEYSA